MNERPASTLVLATRNAHKAGEICAILGDQFDYLTLADFPSAPAVVEDAETFAGNAAKKAVELAAFLSSAEDERVKSVLKGEVHLLADDSGLEVDALNGAPGVHSARFAALDSGKSGNSSDADNNAKLLRLLKDVPPEKRTARFRCVIALVAFHHSSFVLQPRIFEGVCEGRIGDAPRGSGGFGYDPLFTPVGTKLTFGELVEGAKHRFSHRAKALEQLRDYFQNKP